MQINFLPTEICRTINLVKSFNNLLDRHCEKNELSFVIKCNKHFLYTEVNSFFWDEKFQLT